MNPSLEDRRLFDRFAARVPAKIKDSRDNYGQSLYLRDASADGAQVMSKQQFYINDSLTIDIEIPGQYPLTLKGSVVWVSKQSEDRWDLGLKFYKLDLIELSRLYERVSPSVL